MTDHGQWDKVAGSNPRMIVSRRQATKDDQEFARAVHHRAYREVIERQYGTWDERAQDTYFDEAWSAANHEIVMCDAVPCGYCCVEHRQDDVLLRELVIDPDFQGRGIGTRILEDILNHARGLGLPVRLQTQTLNRAAGLYRRMGFHETSRTHTHILMKWQPEEPAS